MPNVFCSHSVTKPVKPNVARKAKASVTPPNWASTPQAAVTTRRSTPSGSPVETAYASSAPSTAPSTAVTADSQMLRTSALHDDVLGQRPDVAPA